MLSHHKYTYFKNNAKSSWTCISLCKHLKVSVFLYLLRALNILQGGPLMQEGGLYKNRAFSLESLDILSLSRAKKLDFKLEFTVQGVSLLVWGKCVSGLRFSSFHS